MCCVSMLLSGVSGPINILFYNDVTCHHIESDLMHQSSYDSLVGIPMPDTNVSMATCHMYSTNPYYYRLYYIHEQTAVQLEYWGSVCPYVYSAGNASWIITHDRLYVCLSSLAS